MSLLNTPASPLQCERHHRPRCERWVVRVHLRLSARPLCAEKMLISEMATAGHLDFVGRFTAEVGSTSHQVARCKPTPPLCRFHSWPRAQTIMGSASRIDLNSPRLSALLSCLENLQHVCEQEPRNDALLTLPNLSPSALVVCCVLSCNRCTIRAMWLLELAQRVSSWH